MKIKPVCKCCGSTDVRCEGLLEWNILLQKLELDDILESTYCHKCEDDREIEWGKS